MKISSLAPFKQKSLPVLAGVGACIVRNDNDSNPNPGWDRAVFRN
jgi:hypothetical protein